MPAAYSVCADEQSPILTRGDFFCREQDGGIVITGVSFSINDERRTLTVPASIDGKPVTAIGDDAFVTEACIELTEINLPNTLKTIGSNAFYGCQSMKSLTLPEGLETIGTYAFRSARIESIVIPESVRQIKMNAFASCKSLKSVQLPEAVTEIQWNTFYNCTALEKVVLSPKTTHISRGAFMGCTALREINLPDTLEYVYSNAFNDTEWLAAKYARNVPVCSDGGVFLIDGRKCAGDVVLPDTVQRINEQAFAGNESVTGVTIPDSVTEIGIGMFFNCTALKKVVLPSGITEIPDMLFNRSGLEEFTVPDGITKIGFGAFMTCKELKKVVLPESLITIADGAFLECYALEELNIPEQTVNIGTQIAAMTPWLEKQHEKDGAYVIINQCLLDADGITGTAVLPDGIKRICGSAFLDSETLTGAVVPASVEYIGAGAFYVCENLHMLTVLNPDCFLSDPETDPDNTYGVTIIPKTYSGLFRGYEESTLKKYAEHYQIRFDPISQGDADGDAQVTIADAQSVLKAYTDAVAGKADTLTDEKRKAADVNGDSAVTVEDAQLILKYYVSNTVAGNAISWKELL